MRYRITIVTMVAVLASCGSGGLPQEAHPTGWTSHRIGAREIWTNPKRATETFERVERSFEGANSDLASQIALDMVLHQHAKLLGTVAFAPCPGEAGLQTYKAPGKTILVAFAVYNGRALKAFSSRPAGTPEDPAVTDALARTVCTKVL